MKPTRHAAMGRQGGVALFVVLIFLVILTLLGVTAMQGATVGEKLARNDTDRNLAMQAAEAALRDAERDLETKKADGTECTPGSTGCRPKAERPIRGKNPAGITPFTDTCKNGQCKKPDNAYFTTPVWTDASNWSDNAVQYGTFTGAADVLGVRAQPKYLIEGWRRGTAYIFRITAQGYGATPASTVTLQSLYVLRPS